MKLRWLAILVALSVGVPACSDKAKDTKAEKDDDDDDKKKDKKDGDKKDGDKKSADGDKKDGDKKEGSNAPPPPADDDPPPPPAPTELPKAPMTAEQIKTFLGDKDAKLTADAYETLLLGLADCTVDRYGIDYKCQARKDFYEGLKHKAEDYKSQSKVALKHVRHPKPAVRYEAASGAENAAFGYEAADDAPQKYIDAVRAEKDNVVLAHYVSVWYGGARKSAKVRNIIVRLLEHEDARVREQAVRRLADRDVAKEVDGYYDRMLARIENDKDNEVRAHACSGLSLSEDAKAIPVLVKLIDDSGTPDEVRDGCFEGLVASWTGFPYPKKPNKDGYEATMKILEKTERTDKFPPNRGMSKLAYAKTEFKDYDSGKEWYAEAKGFYDKARLVKALTAIASDDKAGQWTRSDALYNLQRLGEQKVLEGLVEVIKKQSGSEAKSLSEKADKLSKEKTNY